MNIDKTIGDMLSTEKGMKKVIRKIVYRALAPLLSKFQDEFKIRSDVYSNKIVEITEVNQSKLNEHEIRVLNVETNIRNNNTIIKDLQRDLETNSNAVNKVFDYALTIGEEVKNNTSSNYSKDGNSDVTSNEVVASKDSKGKETKKQDSYTGIDYFDFENRFRGSRESIKKVQEQYLEYYTGKKNVVDIGCGRGEFLELLKDHQIGYVGIDLYGKSIECCKLLGLNVLQEDAILYLNNCESVDGIFAGQLVEHLTMEQITRLCEVAYNKLEKDCYMILETPNPTSLAIYTHAFYMDPSHIKPVHPLTLQYCAEKAGFKEVKILYTNSSLLPVSIPKLEGSNINNLKAFNDAMEIVSNTLFGSQDYAIIAKK